MSMIAVDVVIRSSLIATASAPAFQSSSATRRRSFAADEIVALVAARRHGLVGVLELEDDAGPGQRDQAGGDARLLELAVERPDGGLRARAVLLDRLDLSAEGHDPVLELILLVLESQRRLDQRRPLLARVPDARPLGGELGGDQEAEQEQRDAERQLPARDRPDAAREGAHRGGSSGSTGPASSAPSCTPPA